ncbi:hypothetical protein [Mycolicibacterium canariasense]|uniref:hypothetical protein n=1 Tax=Mycolicibacterium canariasense TaxID=228230 RepID=UPI000AB4C361|nr:hypothetical protein [Mycolicibacterium canariasense]MCV7209414.1 hypothetical protein [Mycolicibacterium canariasense]
MTARVLAGVTASNVVDLASRRARHDLRRTPAATRRRVASADAVGAQVSCRVLPFRRRPTLSQQLHGFR